MIAVDDEFRTMEDQRACERCGNPLPIQVGRGRPRKLCFTCRPGTTAKPASEAVRERYEPDAATTFDGWASATGYDPETRTYRSES